MGLVSYAENELKAIGAFDKDSAYDGGIGESVLELVKVFAAQGHSGGSAHLTLEAFDRVARFRPLAPLKNPALTGEYMEVCTNPSILQSTRRSSVFSVDGGKTWYDINKRVHWLKRLFGVKRAYIKFAA